MNRALEKQAVVLGDGSDVDVIALAEDPLEVAVQVFYVRGGRIRGQRGWVADRVEEGGTPELVEDFLLQLYAGDWRVLLKHRIAGHISGFMAQKGRRVVCGDAGEALGDSIYEARLYVRGDVAGLAADCVRRRWPTSTPRSSAGCSNRRAWRARSRSSPSLGLARRLYNFHVDHAGEY